MMIKPAGYLIETHGLREGMPGVFYDYVLASNGLFVQAGNELMAASVCIAPAEVRGLEPLQEYVQLFHGKMPWYLYRLILNTICALPDVEQFLAIAWENNSYTIKVPPQDKSAGSVKYETVENAVLEVHSHAGGLEAFFSGTDNRDEQGFRLYAVVGSLRELFPTVEIRAGVYGYFMPVSKEDVFV